MKRIIQNQAKLINACFDEFIGTYYDDERQLFSRGDMRVAFKKAWADSTHHHETSPEIFEEVQNVKEGVTRY